MSCDYVGSLVSKVVWWRPFATIVLILLSQSGAAMGQEGLSGPVPQDDPASIEFAKANRLAEQGKSEGYRLLISLANSSESAEWSAVAIVRIWRLMHSDTPKWLRAMAPLDGPSLRAFLAGPGQAWVVPQGQSEYDGGLPTFRRDVLARLRAAKGTPRELALAQSS